MLCVEDSSPPVRSMDPRSRFVSGVWVEFMEGRAIRVGGGDGFEIECGRRRSKGIEQREGGQPPLWG